MSCALIEPTPRIRGTHALIYLKVAVKQEWPLVSTQVGQLSSKPTGLNRALFQNIILFRVFASWFSKEARFLVLASVGRQQRRSQVSLVGGLTEFQGGNKPQYLYL